MKFTNVPVTVFFTLLQAIVPLVPFIAIQLPMQKILLAVIPKAEFGALVGCKTMVLKSFINILARNIHENEKHLMGIAFQSVRKKVAFVLVSLYHKYHNTPEKPFIIDMSRENLASIAGIAKESMIRTLSDFNEENLIQIEAGCIQVLNYPKLRQLGC